MTGFSHVTINVRDLSVSLPFYVGVLGMRLVWRGERDVYLEWGSAWVCLQERPSSGAAPVAAPGSVDHVAFHVPAAHFSDAVARLEQANVPIVRGPVLRGAGWTINYLDPDGTQLELHTATLQQRLAVWDER